MAVQYVSLPVGDGFGWGVAGENCALELARLAPTRLISLGTMPSRDSERQQALAKGSQRWVSMTPEQRLGAQQRFSQWRAMPPEQRQQLRQRWQQFKSMPPEQQQRVRESFNRFRQMPPERRMQLRRQWRQMTPEQRHRANPHPAPPRHYPR